MREFFINRMAEEPGVYTLGIMVDAEQKQVGTIAERGWVDKNGDGLGDRNESRIPAGTYECERAIHHPGTPGAYEVWRFKNVPGRDCVDVHVGNDPRRDSKGCPLIGTGFGPKGTITQSKAAFDKWMKLTKNEERIRITVRDIPK